MSDSSSSDEDKPEGIKKEVVLRIKRKGCCRSPKLKMKMLPPVRLFSFFCCCSSVGNAVTIFLSLVDVCTLFLQHCLFATKDLVKKMSKGKIKKEVGK